MRHLVLVFSLVALFSPLFGQKSLSDAGPFRVGVGLNADIEFIDQDRATDLQMAGAGLSYIDIHLNINIIKFIDLKGGFTVTHFKDKMSLSEAVAYTGGTLQGLPSDTRSGVNSTGFYYAAGTIIPVYSKLAVMAYVGNRTFNTSRKVRSCEDCTKTDVDVPAGLFVQGGVALLPVSEDRLSSQIYMLYTHYFEEGLKYSVGVGFTFRR